MAHARARTVVTTVACLGVLVGVLAAPAAATDSVPEPTQAPSSATASAQEPSTPADPSATDADAQVVSVTTEATDGSVAVRSVLVDDPSNTARVVDSLRAAPGVTSARVSVPIHRLGLAPTAVIGPDPYLSRQWGLGALDRTRSWPLSSGNRITVAVIDDGVDLGHPDLQGALLTGYNVAHPTKPVDPGQHGTHVIGILAARYRNSLGGAGYAPSVKVLPVDVFDGEIATDASVARGVTWAAAQPGLRIISMSLGSSDRTPLLEKAIIKARAAGILVVAAAGNDGDSDYDGVRDPETHASYPANYAGVVGVGASSKTNSIALFSSAGSQVDLTAPGIGIYSTWVVPNACLKINTRTGACALRGIKHTYAYESGTSMATPFVAAAAALVWARFPSWTANDVASQLQARALDRGIKGRDTTYGAGVVQPYAVLNGSSVSPGDVAVTSGATSATDPTSPVTVTWGPAALRRLYPIDSWRVQASFDGGGTWQPSVSVPYAGHDCVAERCSLTFADAPTNAVTTVVVWAIAGRTAVAGPKLRSSVWNGHDAGSTVDTARPLTANQPVSDAIGAADTDLFSWTSVDGAPFTVSSSGGASGQTLRIYPAGDTESAVGPVSIGTDLPFSPGGPGTYIVEVTGTAASATRYELVLSTD